jgi:hypothetical protein
MINIGIGLVPGPSPKKGKIAIEIADDASSVGRHMPGKIGFMPDPPHNPGLGRVELPACFVGGTLVCVPNTDTETTVFVTAGTGGSDHNWLASTVLFAAACALQLPIEKRRKRRARAGSPDADQSAWGYPTEVDETNSNQHFPEFGDVDILNEGALQANQVHCVLENCGQGIDETPLRSDRQYGGVHKTPQSIGFDALVTLRSRCDLPRTRLSQRMASAFRFGLAGLLLLAAALAFRMESSVGPPVVSRLTSTPANVSDRFAVIEQIRVGERVFADNPDLLTPVDNTRTAVDPQTWQHLILQADFQWPDGTPDPVFVETLQPQEWMAAQQVTEGSEVDLPLDLREMGLPANLRARVVRVQPCPSIALGPGQVVLTTVNHLHNHVVEVIVRNERGEREAIRPTNFHKFYSETRNAWVSAEDLQVDEVLAGRNGSIVVVSQSRVPGIHRVFNMTVEGEHVYHVGHSAALVHNNCHEADVIRNKKVIIHDELPYDDAVKHVQDGGELVTDSVGEAQKVAEDATGHPPLWHEPHRRPDGGLNQGHYHPVTPDGTKLPQHIIPIPRRL